MSRETDDLNRLMEHAPLLAKAYTRVTSALMKEGVPEDIARFEARCIVMGTLMDPQQEDREPWED